jgi:hypothetical protein
MSNLRLLLWEDCNRACPGCCNKDWDLTNLPIVEDFSGYDMVMLTGGEVMLAPYAVKAVAKSVRKQTSAPIIVYTAKSSPADALIDVLESVDGITLTLHDQSDVEPFQTFNDALKAQGFGKKSLRLNVFKGIDLSGVDTEGWRVQKDMVWLKNCPLPKNEVFMRLTRPTLLGR